jgi:hypothetical protein|uniref:ASCH domain protein n=1 Tax=Siphoviridae sp. ctGuJ10 TaxID=2825418 RepID=A0A8S5PSJ8_9CAUD|nr:MAG TPA: ASCH domain protein [Siphoviridae sp. ctGuJ10]
MKPILFNTEMIKAILDGKKTCTRRKFKLPKEIIKENDGTYTLYADCDGYYPNQDLQELFLIGYLLPRYKVGDILYVRETFKTYTKRIGKGENCHIEKFIGYKADSNIDVPSEFYEDKWKPSIHMPKDLARIFLKVTNIKFEKLQDIANDEPGVKNQVVKEGFNYLNDFIITWNKTIDKKEYDKYCWDANPYVWVYEFEVITKKQAIDLSDKE